MTDFVHLHLHTEYSLLDGAVRLVQAVVDEAGKTQKVHPLCDALKKRDMKAVAITDHGNMYGAFTFVSTCRMEGIKPIIGQEFYVADDMYAKTADVLKQRYHLVLLAKNMTGYKNLMALSSMAFVDGFYMKPRVDLKHIAEHSEGLICLSACLAGQVPQLILQNKYEEAKAVAIRMRDMFEPGDFYIELQDHHLLDDRRVMNPLCQIAKEIGVKVVATNDVHYIEKEDADTQDTMMCVTLGCKKEEMNSARFENDEFYLKSGDEMAELFSWCPEAISSTIEIADKVQDYFVIKHEPIIPIYKSEEMGDRSAQQYLHDLAYEGAVRKYGEMNEEIEQRLDYELGVIHDCGFDGYFLIVWDYVHAAQQMDIPVGPGRGSGCGSIVAYSIGITDIDPLKYQLLFERFLSKERVSMPDFDIDFCFVRRQEVIDYCIQKYGADQVSQIIAYSTMSAKAVVKDVARVFDIPYNEAANWVKAIPVGKVLLPQVLSPESEVYSDDFKKLYDTNPTAKRVIDVAMKLEGMPRQTSMHAAGVVICADPVVEHCALSRNGNVVTTQFDKAIVEELGLLKMDFLGLKTLTDIDEALKLIKDDKGIELDFHKIGYDDPEVYKLISSGDCEAVFQLESGGMKKFMTQLQPDSLEDVIAGISMYRPGPMQFIDEFVRGKHHPETVTYAHPLLKDILENTYGCIVYQEQVMQIAQKIAGFSFGGADIMRRAIAKKKLDVLEKQRDIFINGGSLGKDDKTGKYVPGAVANGVSADIANHLFDQILKFASYAFNKSHAAAYTFLTYQTAYLKLYYPTHFIVAVVNNRILNADELKHYINYLRRSGVSILSPDINRSQKLFSIEGNDVRYGLMGIKNVGEQAMEFVLNERKRGAFRDIRDFLERCAGQVNKRMVESLIKGGAFDSFGKNRATLMASYERIMDTVAADRKNRLTGQMSLFDELIADTEVKYTERDEYPKKLILSYEKEVLGMYISGHPLEDYHDDKGEFNFDTNMLYVEGENEDNEVVMVVNKDLASKQVKFGGIVSSYQTKATQKQQKFAVGIIEDSLGTIDFTMYPRVYEQYGALLASDEPLKIYGRVDLHDESEPKISVDRLEIWQNTANKTKEVSKGILYVLLEDAGKYKFVESILQMYQGATPCQAQMKVDGKYRLVEFSTKVDVCDELLHRLQVAIGDKCVKFVAKN